MHEYGGIVKLIGEKTSGGMLLVDYATQSPEAQMFADGCESACSARRRRLGYKGEFNTTGDQILTAYLAGYLDGLRVGSLPAKPDKRKRSGMPPAEAFEQGRKILEERKK
jgi:hypothetical protein